MRIKRKAITECLGILGWKHCELARRVGIPPETLSRWLNSQMPTVPHLRKLVETLNDALEKKGSSVKMDMEDLIDD